MDDPLRGVDSWKQRTWRRVLILVVMDDPLRGIEFINSRKDQKTVLILVVMDDPLRALGL